MKITKYTPYIRNPLKLTLTLGRKGFLKFVPDKVYLKLVYFGEIGKKLNLIGPVTYNEKLQWLKLYNRKPEHCVFVDKYAVREYIKSTIGEEYLIPLISVYDNVNAINWNQLPKKFVMKCTHGSGSNIICEDKDKLDVKDAIKKLNKWMKINWYWYGREWPYKNLKPRIICEEYLMDNIIDYKFMCFNGEPKLVQVHCNRAQENYSLDFYDMNWHKTDIKRCGKESAGLVEKPKRFDEMMGLVKALSRDDIHVRIDLYEVADRIYFGEKTYFSASGFSPYAKEEHDKLLGSFIELPNENH